MISGAKRIWVGWDTVWVGLVGGQGRLLDAVECSKICKKFLKNIEKCIILAYFPKIKKPSFFANLDEKSKLKICDENSIEKLKFSLFLENCC